MLAISTNGTVLTRLAGALYNTQMSNATYKEVAALDPSSLANVLYARDFGTISDATVATTLVANLGLTAVQGLSNWLAGQLTAAGANKGAKIVELLNGFAQMTGDAAYGAAATNFNTKVNTALALSQTTDNAGGAFDSISTAVAGKTFTLTTGVDNLTGTSGSDSFSGLFDTSSGSLTSVDTINGGGGTDTLSMRITSMGTAISTSPSISSIEILSIDNDVTTGTVNNMDFNTGSVSGITDIISSGSSEGSVTLVTNVAATVKASLTSTRGTLAIDFGSSVFATTSDQISVAFNAAGNTASGGTAAKLILDATGGPTGASANDTLETVTITSDTAASRVDLAGGSAVKTLNISGAAALTLTDSENSFSAVTSVAASTMTAALNITVENTNNMTVTTGSGNDRVAVGAIGTNLTSGDSINLGTGTDTIAVSDATFDATDLTLIKSLLTTAEVIEITTSLGTAAAGSYNMNSISIINTLLFSASGQGTAGVAGTGGSAGGTYVSIAGVEAGDQITLSANQVGGIGGGDVTGATAAFAGGVAIALTPLVDGGSDAITINLTGGRSITGGQGGTSQTGATAGNGGNAITASGFETINIVSTGTTANTIAGGGVGATGAGTVANASAGSSIVINTNGTINVTGTQDVNLGTISGTNASVIATNFTGKLTVVAEAGNNTIAGGSAVDTINGAAGIDTITGNGGADVFQFQLGSTTVASHSSFMNAQSATTTATLSVDSITDFAKGSDSIVVLSTASAAQTLSATNIKANGTAAVGTAAISSKGVTSFAAADDTLYERVIATEAGLTTGGGGASSNNFAYFEFDGSTYVFVSDATAQVDRGDVLIKLTGVTGITDVGFTSTGGLTLS